MTFEQPHFYFFLLVILLVCSVVKMDYRWFPLLCGGFALVFFLNGKLLFLFLLLATANFYGSRLRYYKTFYFPLLVASNLLFLFFYKYLKYFLPSELSLDFKIILPIGISFFVFQQLSYLIDSSRDRLKTAPHLGQYLTYSFFIGTFASGPIERFANVSESLKSIKLPDVQTLRKASLLIIWGLFKKIAIADNISPKVSNVFNSGNNPVTANELLSGVLLNKYEIFANFSGYTDIALGVGLLFGLTLTPNFKNTFAAVTIKDFWKRWHLSLSYWIRDYVFYPLSTSFFSRFGIYFLLSITFLVFAIWHDLKTTFIIYAFIQVFLIFLSDKTASHRNDFIKRLVSQKCIRALNLIRQLWVYVVLLSIPGIFFKAQTLKGAQSILVAISSLSLGEYLEFVTHISGSGVLIIFLIFVCENIERRRGKFEFADWLERKSYMVEVLFYFCVFLLFITFAKYNSNTGFIYGNF